MPLGDTHLSVALTSLSLTRPDADGGRLRPTPQSAVHLIDIPARRQAFAPPELPGKRCSSSSTEPGPGCQYTSILALALQ